MEKKNDGFKKFLESESAASVPATVAVPNFTLPAYQPRLNQEISVNQENWLRSLGWNETVGPFKRQAIERQLTTAIAEFANKLDVVPIVDLSVQLSIKQGAVATINFAGAEQTENVAPHIAIVGDVYYQDGEQQNFFQRWLGKPRWEYSHSPKAKPATK